MKKEIEQLTSEKTIAQNKFNKDKNDMTVAYNKLKEERDALSKFKEKIIKERIEVEEREDFESPQAKVVYVDLNGVLVDINLGRRHGLKAGLRFSILNQDTLRMTEATPKAQIEITRVTESQATGRVIQDRNNVPVIPGDLVYSPTWRVGGTVKYAMVGKMDIDGNGSDDRQAVRDLIVRNGGEVVEDVGPDNKPSGGKLDENTRFLIVGEMPKALEGNANDPISREIGARYADIRSRARSFTVAEMTLEKLLGYLRKNDDDKTIGLGDATRGADFKERSGPLRSSLEGVRDTGIRPSGPLSGTGGR